MSKMTKADLCMGCVRNGGTCVVECTQCEFDDELDLEFLDMEQLYFERKQIGYNRRQNAIKAKARADMALQAVTAKRTALPKAYVTEAHGRVARRLKKAEKQVYRVRVTTIELEFPKVPDCFDKSIKASDISDLFGLLESWKDQTRNRKVYTEDQAEPIINACDNIIEILKWVNEVHEAN